MTEEKAKAYIIEDKWNSEGCCVVWATNSNKAKSIANYYDLFDTCYYTELRAKRAPQYDKYAESKKIPIKELLANGWWFYCDGGCGKTLSEDDINDGQAFIIDKDNTNEIQGGIICANCKKKAEERLA